MPVRSRRFDPAAIKTLILEEAFARGAGAVAVTSASTDEPARERMREAFAREDFKTWNFGDSYARTAADPQSILDGARSVICVAVPYATPAPRPEPLHGRVSKYAWSADYHRGLQTLLRAVAAAIDEAAGAAVTAVACDTKPIAERAFAARAGLGWIGKHTNLIAPQLGSYVFLGEILTTLALTPDAPLRKSCGTCERCIEVCPTRALRGDYTIDANRCIADLTQRTDAIPRKWRPYIGEWVWGCDLCQDICPPTRFAGSTGGPSMEPLDSQIAAPSLASLLRLRSGDFKRRYERSAMGWRGAAVLRRNAAVALGNTLDRAAIPSLIEALREDPHPMVRGHVAWALGRIGAPAAFAALQAQLVREAEASVREEIESALAEQPLAAHSR